MANEAVATEEVADKKRLSDATKYWIGVVLTYLAGVAIMITTYYLGERAFPADVQSESMRVQFGAGMTIWGSYLGFIFAAAFAWIMADRLSRWAARMAMLAPAFLMAGWPLLRLILA